MTRLVAAELRKVWRSRFFLVALAALLGANLFLLWVGTKPALSPRRPITRCAPTLRAWICRRWANFCTKACAAPRP